MIMINKIPQISSSHEIYDIKAYSLVCTDAFICSAAGCGQIQKKRFSVVCRRGFSSIFSRFRISFAPKSAKYP